MRRMLQSRRWSPLRLSTVCTSSAGDKSQLNAVRSEGNFELSNMSCELAFEEWLATVIITCQASAIPYSVLVLQDLL